MADHADDGDDIDVFVYMGGDQEVPRDVTHIRIHRSVKIITRGAFQHCRNLVSIEMHDGVEIIEYAAFEYCKSLRRIKLPGVRIIERLAFFYCTKLADVEFGDKLETIGSSAFASTALRTIKILKVRVIEFSAFAGCEQLMEAELSGDLESIGYYAFGGCRRLRHIAIPLKENLLEDNSVFSSCENLSQVDIVGGFHNTISSLLLESWRQGMKDGIDRINQDLPNTPKGKTTLIGIWMRSVLDRIDHYKSEHYVLLKEFTTLLELALWKAKLDESQYERSIRSDQHTKKATIDVKAARQEKRITSGANIVIKNVLPFLKLE
jgi:hypothetical protein